MSDFGKISTPSLKEVCVQAILTKILSGELKPGDKLPAERDMAEAMGVSRSSVNHGIVELEAMGFLTGGSDALQLCGDGSGPLQRLDGHPPPHRE